MEETDNICFVCDKTIPTDKWKYKLQVTATKKQNVPVADLIQQLVGDDCAVLVGERDAVCSRCMNLLNLMDSLTAQLSDVREMLTYLLDSKYNLASASIQVDFDDSTPIETEPLHKCSLCEFETKYEKEFNMHTRTHKLINSNKTSAIKPKITKQKYQEPKAKFGRKSTSPKSKKYTKKQKKLSKPKKKKIVFQCSVCDKIFPDEVLIKSHAKKEHGNDNIIVTSDDEYEDVQTLESPDEKLSDAEINAPDKRFKPDIKKKLDFLDDWIENNSDDEIKSPKKKQKTDVKPFNSVEAIKNRDDARKLSFEDDYEEDNDSSSKPTCMFCHATFSSLQSVQDHIKLSHQQTNLPLGSKNPLSTNVASFEIDSTTDITENNIKSDLGNGNQPPVQKLYNCKWCGIRKVSLQFIQKHIKLHKRKMSLQCKLCGTTFKNIAALKIHSSKCLKVASSSIKCSYCTFKFFDRSQLKNHIEKVHKKTLTTTAFSEKTVSKEGSKLSSTNEISLKSNFKKVKSNMNNITVKSSTPDTPDNISFSEVTSTSIENEISVKKEEKSPDTAQDKDKLVCKDCNLTFSRRCRLTDHLNKHVANKCLDLGICIYCDELFLDKRQVVIHSAVKHERMNNSAECPVCKKVYSLLKDMRIHYLRSHFNKNTEELMNQMIEYKAKQCKNTADTENKDVNDVYSKVLKELQDITGEGTDSEDLSVNSIFEFNPNYYCPLCSFKTKEKDELNNHFVSHTQSYCNICKHIFSPDESIKHIENHSLEFKGLICPTCQVKCHDDIHLQCHIEIDHPGTRPFKCTMCEKTYTTEKSVLTHEQIQHGKKSRKVLSCNKCDMNFYSEKDHKTHIEFAHRSSLNCKYCDKNIPNVKQLIIHERNHLKQVKSIFKCNVCGKVLKSQIALKTHKLNHNSGSTLNCDVCSRSFKSFHSLREHSAKHSEAQQKKYFCDICGKGFYFYDSHCRHRRLHLDPLLFKCKICKARFQTKQKLIEHNKVCGKGDGGLKI